MGEGDFAALDVTHPITGEEALAQLELKPPREN
jgi:hypothetical protein